MKVYRREVEENGIVVDPLKSFHTIKVIEQKTKLSSFVFISLLLFNLGCNWS